MATYIIGDIQGCYDALQQLLEKINFDPQHDQLGFVGDLVNRGAQSLLTLRFIKSLSDPIIVLGNHDLHLLALGYDLIQKKNSQTLDQILQAPDKIEILDWLRQQPLIYYNQQLNFLMVHAGLPPQWSIVAAIAHANEITSQLRGDNFRELLSNMHGNEPSTWHDKLTGMERYRYIINAMTRIRYCDHAGHLDLINKSNISSDPKKLKPWFSWRADKIDIIFGHWAALAGQCQQSGMFAIDTGCIWGGKLTAIRIEDKKLFCVGC